MAGGNRSAAAKKGWITRKAGGGVIGRGAIGGSYIGGRPGSSARSAAFKRLVAYAKANKAEGNWGNS